MGSINPAGIKLRVIIPDNVDDFGVSGPILEPTYVFLEDIINILKSDDPLTFRLVGNDKNTYPLTLAIIASTYSLDIDWRPRPGKTEEGEQVIDLNSIIEGYIGIGVKVAEDLGSDAEDYEKGIIKNPTDALNQLFTLSANGKQALVDALRGIGMYQVTTKMTFQDLADLISTISSWGMTVGGGKTVLELYTTVLEKLLTIPNGVLIEVSSITMCGEETFHTYDDVVLPYIEDSGLPENNTATYAMAGVYRDDTDLTYSIFNSMESKVLDMVSETNPCDISYDTSSIGYDYSDKLLNNIICANIAHTTDIDRLEIYISIHMTRAISDFEVILTNTSLTTGIYYTDIIENFIMKFDNSGITIGSINVPISDFNKLTLDIGIAITTTGISVNVFIQNDKEIGNKYASSEDIIDISALDLKTYLRVTPVVGDGSIDVFPYRYKEGEK